MTEAEAARGSVAGGAATPGKDERRAKRLTLAWAGVVLAFALLPLHGALSATVGERETLTTQVGHFVEFAVLAALGSWWACERGARGAVRAAAAGLAGAVLLGAVIEAVQSPLPYRSAQLGDLALDAAGALAGALAFSAVRALRARARRARVR